MEYGSEVVSLSPSTSTSAVERNYEPSLEELDQLLWQSCRHNSLLGACWITKWKRNIIYLARVAVPLRSCSTVVQVLPIRRLNLQDVHLQKAEPIPIELKIWALRNHQMMVAHIYGYVYVTGHIRQSVFWQSVSNFYGKICANIEAVKSLKTLAFGNSSTK